MAGRISSAWSWRWKPARTCRGGLRDVLEVLDTLPLVDAELMEFTHWLSDYYFAPWGLVLQAALPAVLRTRTRRRFQIAPAGMELLEIPFSDLSAP